MQPLRALLRLTQAEGVAGTHRSEAGVPHSPCKRPSGGSTMKAYALLLGMMLTLGSGYAAQVAVSSVGTARDAEVRPTPAPRSHGPDTVWYGGVLDPIPVEARGRAPGP